MERCLSRYCRVHLCQTKCISCLQRTESPNVQCPYRSIALSRNSKCLEVRYIWRTQDSSDSIVNEIMVWMTVETWPYSWEVQEISRVSESSSPMAGPTQTHIQREQKGRNSRSVKLTTHLHLVLRLRWGAAVCPLPYMPSEHAERQVYLL
jgi:hypothetical protein